MSEEKLRSRIADLERTVQRLLSRVNGQEKELEGLRQVYTAQVAPAYNKLIAGANVTAIDLVVLQAWMDKHQPGWDAEFREAVERAAKQQEVAVLGPDGKVLVDAARFDAEKAANEQMVELLTNRLMNRVRSRVAAGATPDAAATLSKGTVQ